MRLFAFLVFVFLGPNLAFAEGGSGYRYYRNGQWYSVSGSTQANRAYQTQATGNCVHTPYGSQCHNNYYIGHTYDVSNNGAPYASGTIGYQGGANRYYQHNGSGYAVNSVIAQEELKLKKTKLLERIAEQKARYEVIVATYNLKVHAMTPDLRYALYNEIVQVKAQIDQAEREVMALP